VFGVGGGGVAVGAPRGGGGGGVGSQKGCVVAAPGPQRGIQTSAMHTRRSGGHPIPHLNGGPLAVRWKGTSGRVQVHLQVEDVLEPPRTSQVLYAQRWGVRRVCVCGGGGGGRGATGTHGQTRRSPSGGFAVACYSCFKTMDGPTTPPLSAVGQPCGQIAAVAQNRSSQLSSC
jgi:hypothetical protein